MSYKIEIADSTSHKIEISSSVNDQTPTVQILEGHSSDINVSHDIALLPSDFNDNVKTIIDNFLAAGYGISIVPSGSFLRISTSGLQPSGNYSLVGHSHFSTDITNFNSSVSGLLPVKNVVSGSGIAVSDINGTFTVAVTGQFGLTSEQVDDRVSSLLSSGYGINLSYDDNNNLLTISTIGLQPSGNYSVVGHSHVAADISDFVSAASGSAPVQTVAGRTGNIVLTKNDVGLNNVDNTSDTNKPISSATQNALNLKSDVGHVHTSSNITDFSSSVSGLLPVKNILSGSGISVTSSGSDFTVAVTGQFGLTSEQVDDRISNLLVAGNYVNLNYNDSADILTVSVTGVQPSGNYSIIGHSHVISDVSGLQNALDSKQPSGNYANFVHVHTSSDITDFNSSVSGLLPVKNIIGSGYVNISSSSGNFTVSVNGLQPSGNYANSAHTHTSSQITDFNTSVSGLLTPYATINSPNFSGIPTAPTATSGTNNSQIANTQFVRTEISNLVNSAPSTLDTLNELANALGNDPNFATTVTNTLSGKANLTGASFSGAISGPSGDFGVLKQSGVVVSVSGHSHSYADITNFASGVVDNLTTTLLAGSFINLSYNSIQDSLTINASGLQPSGNYSVVGHTHVSSDITNFNSSVSGLLPTVANSGSNRLLTSTGTTVGIDAQPNLTFNGSLLNVNGSGVFASGLNIANQTASTIASFDSNKNVVSLSTSTYPSLTELAHVKGVTSSVQTQLDNKAASSHTHSSSQITDFNSSVSGLLPVTNILSGVGISVSNSSGVYTIEATGSGILSDQAKSLVTTVFNKTGSPIPKMTAVYINGGQGDLPTVSLAIATSDMTSAGTYGLTYETIPNMQSGQVIVFGALTGLNTDQFNPTAPQGDVNGSVLYLSPSVSGSLTLTKPGAPNHIVAIGTIVRTHQNEGVIEVRVQNGFELEELHNVAISGVTNGQFLQYNSGTQLWVPSSSGNFSTLQVNGTGVSLSGHTHTSSSITDFNSSVSGLLPTISNSGDNRILTSDGTSTGLNAENNLTFDGSFLNVAGSGSFSNNVVASGFVRTGGASSQFLKADGSVDSNTYYLNSNPSGYTTNVGTVTSVAALTLGTAGTDVSSSVANSTTTPVITLNIPSASASNRGLLTSSDWTTFNNKQNALINPITGTGTSGYLSRFNSSTGLTNSIVFESGTRLGVNTISPSGALHVIGSGLIASVTGTAPNSLFHIYSATSGASIFNVEGTNGSLFSVDDNLSGTLMSVNNNAGLPVFEVFSDDRVVAGRFNQNDFVVNSSGNIGIGNSGDNTYKINITGSGNFTGAVTASGIVTGSELTSSQSSGDKGGQINLTKPATNTSINTSVAIDLYQNKLRIFESGGSNRGYYLDITEGAAGVGTALKSKSLAYFTPLDNQPPATNFATIDTRNSIAVLDFDAATKESTVFVGIIPEGANLTSGLNIIIHWMATSATTGNVVWEVSLERSNTDLDSDSFDTVATGTSSTNGTSGIITKTTIALTTIDSVTAGDLYRLKISRDAANGADTMTGDAELVAVEIRG